jgi:hypothetical protein
MSSIQPLATTELPWTPCNVSEETSAHTVGVSSTVSTIFGQATINSSSITSPITVAPHDIECNIPTTEHDLNGNIWYGSDVFSKQSFLLHIEERANRNHADPILEYMNFEVSGLVMDCFSFDGYDLDQKELENIGSQAW